MPKPIPQTTVITHPDGTRVPIGSRFFQWQRGNDKWDALFRELGYTDADRVPRGPIVAPEARILELYNQGLAVPEIASAVERTTSAIYNFLRERGLPADPAKAAKQSRMVELHHKGLTATEISKEIGANGAGSVHAYLKRRGLVPHKRDDNTAEVLRLHSEGWANNDIAEAIGRSRAAVRRVLQPRGLTPNKADREAVMRKVRSNPLLLWAKEARPDWPTCSECGARKPWTAQRQARRVNVGWYWQSGCAVGHSSVAMHGGPLSPEQAQEAQRIYDEMQRPRD